MLSFDQLEPFQVASLFQITFDLKKKEGLPKKKCYQEPFLLPCTKELVSEESFAEVAMCYSEKGIYINVLVDKPFEDTSYPQVTYGDTFEVFFDTRDIKSARIIHKFCHHFVFFPKPQAEVSAIEITQFRGDDAHPLCDTNLLQVESTFNKSSYEMSLFIDREALYGFDPSKFKRLGFTYRVNRKKGDSQHFNVSSRSYPFEKHPNLWSTLILN